MQLLGKLFFQAQIHGTVAIIDLSFFFDPVPFIKETYKPTHSSTVFEHTGGTQTLIVQGSNTRGGPKLSKLWAFNLHMRKKKQLSLSFDPQCIGLETCAAQNTNTY